MNAAEAFRLRLQSLVARGLAATAIAERVGLAAASEVWGGDAPRDRPAWYLWLRGAAGAWQVELAEAEALDAGGVSALVGRFTVRHYPAPGAAVLARFSEEERRIAAEWLDATGTPRIDLASRIPEALFTVGSLEWALDVRGEAAVFALATLDRLRARADGGGLVRDVPGWELTAPIFSLVAGLYAQVERRAASRLALSRLPGFELVGGGRDLEPRDAPDLAHGEALLAFPPAQPHGTAASALVDALRDRDAELVADVSLAPRDPPRSVGAEAGLGLAVSPSWFGGAAHVADRPACAC